MEQFNTSFSKCVCRTARLIIFFISTGQAACKGGPRCSTKAGFYFSSSFPFIFFPPLSLFPLIHSSAIVLRIICLLPPSLCDPLSNWYQVLTSRPAEVKWYKVIGRSAQLTDWPLWVLLLPANQIWASPCGEQSRESRGVTMQMIDDAFSTCLEWSCPHHTVITHSQAAAAQHNCFLFVDLVCCGKGIALARRSAWICVFSSESATGLRWARARLCICWSIWPLIQSCTGKTEHSWTFKARETFSYCVWGGILFSFAKCFWSFLIFMWFTGNWDVNLGMWINLE